MRSLARVLPLVLLALVLGSVLVARQAAIGGPAQFTVTKTDDTADGICDSDCSLREAIIAANASAGHSTINVPAGKYEITRGSGDDSGLMGDFDITTEVTIVGAGADQTFIDGNHLDTVINVIHGGDATLQDLTVQNGDGGAQVATSTGGIAAAGALTLDSVHVINNKGGSNAGGVTGQSTMNISNSLIDGNSSDEDVGGIDAEAGVQITNTTISNNQGGSLAFSGGAYLLGSSTLTNVTISHNIAQSDEGEETGGLITVADSPDTVSATRIKVLDNQATGEGGDGGWTVDGNGVTTGSQVVIDGNTGGNTGVGGLDITHGSLHLSEATISNNAASGDFSTGGILDGASAELTNLTVFGNSSSGDDGTGGLNADGDRLDLTNATISGNTGDGSSQYAADGLVVEIDSTVRNTIVAGNGTKECDNQSASGRTFASLGGNFDTDNSCRFDQQTDRPNTDPMLQPLADNGGFEMTMAVPDGSPAIGAGSNCPASDERGFLRPDPCSSGAFEANGATATPTPSPTPSPTPTVAPGAFLFGDADCGGAINLGDAIAVARFLVGLAVNQADGCPPLGSSVTIDGIARVWQDVTCDGSITLGDSIGVARNLVGLAVNQASGCPGIGSSVQVTS